jgi:outer membrane immunogenic protein
MKKLIAAAVAVGAMLGIGAASAADLPMKALPYTAPPPPFSWTGFYVGENVGGHWSDDKISTLTTDPGGLFFLPGGAAAIDLASPTTLKPSGFTGGLQAGYNWQFGQFVAGIEGDFNWLTGRRSRTLTGFPIVAAGDFETNSDRASYLATIRGRLGTTFIDPRALIYVTGGVAFAQIKTTDAFGAFGGTDVKGVTASTNRTGWAVGGGVEYAITNNWSVKGEYLYADLGNFSVTAPPFTTFGSAFITYNHKYTENIARLGLNYRFSGPY